MGQTYLVSFSPSISSSHRKLAKRTPTTAFEASAQGFAGLRELDP
jgi:hypothetical protein